MTIYKTVVSWLAFLFLAYRGVLLTLAWGLDKWGMRSLPQTDYILWLLGLGGVKMSDVLVWSPLWALVALAVIFPWIAPVLWRTCGWDRGRYSDNPVPVFLNVIGRWGFSILVAGCLLDLFPRGIEGFCRFNPYAAEERFGGYFTGIFAASMLGVFSAMLIAPEITYLASSGFTGFIDAVFFPGGREKLPPYTLKLARFYVEKERWAEAEAEYARMLSFHPKQVEAWQERLALAFERTDEADPAPEEILAASLKALRKEEDREAVHRFFMQHQP
jgi:hypothetical protein